MNKEKIFKLYWITDWCGEILKRAKPFGGFNHPEPAIQKAKDWMGMLNHSKKEVMFKLKNCWTGEQWLINERKIPKLPDREYGKPWEWKEKK